MGVMSANARYPVPRPGPGYELQPYGLFTVANGPLPLPEQASVNGLEWETPYCGLPTGYEVACVPGSKAAALVDGYTIVTGDPFTVLKGSLCGSSNSSADDRRTRDLVLSALYAGEQRAVENIFSRQLVGQARGLSGGGATQLAASANVIQAFALLEAAFGAVYGLPGIIHVPLLAEPMVKREGLVDKVSGKWMTPTGHAVSFGNYAGYTAADVAPAAGNTNIYITAPVTVYRNEPFVSPWAESIDKTTNQIRRFAERTYIVTYECAAFATETSYTTCC